MEANPRHVPDLSVLVPVYGVERYIADCARSLFAQRDVDAEFVFVDDASPDGSVDRLREVMAEYPAVGERVRILRHAHNRGVGAARRTAIEAARGTYICFVDSDDALSDDRALAQLSEEARRTLSLLHISEPTRQAEISYAVFCLKKKNDNMKRVAK